MLVLDFSTSLSFRRINSGKISQPGRRIYSIKYDPKADILALKPKEGVIKNEKLLDSDVVLGFDKGGEPVAPEVWDASKRDY